MPFLTIPQFYTLSCQSAKQQPVPRAGIAAWAGRLFQMSLAGDAQRRCFFSSYLTVSRRAMLDRNARNSDPPKIVPHPATICVFSKGEGRATVLSAAVHAMTYCRPRRPPSTYMYTAYGILIFTRVFCVLFPPPQDTESTSANPPPVPPRPAGSGPSAGTIDTAAGFGAVSDPARAIVAEKGEGEQGGIAGGGGSSGLGSEEEEAEVVEELPLPELYVPGRIVHIYRQGRRGGRRKGCSAVGGRDWLLVEGGWSLRDCRCGSHAGDESCRVLSSRSFFGDIHVCFRR